MKVINIKNCARCGENHDQLEARELARSMSPPECAPLQWTHWAPCPTNGDPIMIVVVSDGDDVPNGKDLHPCPRT